MKILQEFLVWVGFLERAVKFIFLTIVNLTKYLEISIILIQCLKINIKIIIHYSILLLMIF